MNKILKYNQNTGEFIWLISTGRIRAGAVAGSLRKDKYRQIQIDGKLYLEHRMAWFFVHGQWTTDQIDHINGNRTDNRIANLREATNAENQQNLGKNRNNSSGYTGVHWSKQAGKYRADIRVNGKSIYLGLFDDKEEDRQVREDAKARYHQFNPVQRKKS